MQGTCKDVLSRVKYTGPGQKQFPANELAPRTSDARALFLGWPSYSRETSRFFTVCKFFSRMRTPCIVARSRRCKGCLSSVSCAQTVQHHRRKYHLYACGAGKIRSRTSSACCSASFRWRSRSNDVLLRSQARSVASYSLRSTASFMTHEAKAAILYVGSGAMPRLRAW